MFSGGLVTEVSRLELPCTYKVKGKTINVGINAFTGPIPKVGDEVVFCERKSENHSDVRILHHMFVETEPTHESRWVKTAYHTLYAENVFMWKADEAKAKDLLTKMYRKATLFEAMDSHYSKEKKVWKNALGWVATIGALAAAVWSLT